MSGVSDTLLGVGSTLFPQAVIETGLTPPITVGTKSDPNAPDPWWGPLLMPSVTLLNSSGGEAYTLSPYGRPDPMTSTLRFIGVGLVLLLALVGVIFLVRLL